MKTPAPHRPRAPRLVAASLLLLSAGFAQTVVPRDPPSSASSPGEEAITLTPFEVQADSDKSYGAMNSNSITAFNVALDRVPVTANIITESFMKEVGAMTLEGILTGFDAGATYGGAGSGQISVNQPGDHGSNPGIGLRGSRRGLAPQTDGIQLNAGNYGVTNFGSTNNYDIERVEVLMGPQALLYQGAGAGGVVNMIRKQARFGRPTFYEFAYRVDQFGTKYGTFDYGTSKGRFAFRLALVNGSIHTRRVFLKERINGIYLQGAVRFGVHTASISLQQSVDTKTYQEYASITSTGDPVYGKYQGLRLEYLLATGQAGEVLNGKLNWGNSASYAGYQWTDFGDAESGVVKLESVWSRNFSTQLIFGGANYNVLQAGYNATLNLYSPGATANPRPGNWTMGFPASGNPMQASWRPHPSKAIRFVALYSHDFFRGRAQSKTSFDVDSTSTLASLPTQNYYRADENWNIIVDPARNNSAGKYGRTQLPAMSWTVNDGPVLYTLVNPGDKRLVWEGVNYVQQATNLGPQGRTHYYQKGFSLVNYTQWFERRLDTMVGFRANTMNGLGGEDFKKPLYSFGLVYHPNAWLSPYYQFADLWLTAGDQQPDGSYSAPNHNLNHELGVKFTPGRTGISGSLSVYQKDCNNESFNAPGIASIVSVNGLNGQIPEGTGGSLVVKARTHGATAALTASPGRNWRMRLSAGWTGGTFRSGSTFGQLYNDQFYTNSAGQVTYADKSVVYVPATFNSRQLTVPAGTPGAVPLTVAMLSTPSSSYYAQPQPLTGAILKTSNGGLVLLSPADPVHGSMLTGATGLPIATNYQLDTNLSGVAPIGTVFGAQPGGQTFGYPGYAFNYTAVYDFTGPLQGFKLGGTVSAKWKHLVSYYYPGLGQARPENLRKFYAPTAGMFDLIAGYTHKFRRVTWSSQLNVNNLFNHYKVVFYPNVNSGYTVATAIPANFSAQPRVYSWTNRISF